jgi:hypothetical protein
VRDAHLAHPTWCYAPASVYVRWAGRLVEHERGHHNCGKGSVQFAGLPVLIVTAVLRSTRACRDARTVLVAQEQRPRRVLRLDLSRGSWDVSATLIGACMHLAHHLLQQGIAAPDWGWYIVNHMQEALSLQWPGQQWLAGKLGDISDMYLTQDGRSLFLLSQVCDGVCVWAGGRGVHRRGVPEVQWSGVHARLSGAGPSAKHEAGRL